MEFLPEQQLSSNRESNLLPMCRYGQARLRILQAGLFLQHVFAGRASHFKERP
jgi:hypothetical protein